jgi:hypothetical protein
MNLKSLIVALAAAGSASIALADGPSFDFSKHRSTKTRAEVIADLEVYRASGLADLDGREGTEFASVAYAKASQRYAELRKSAAFEQRVAQIARERGEDPMTTAHR